MTKGALPGGVVRGSKTGRPIMAALDLLGRRWTLRILWELRGGALGFRALRAACGEPSPTLLSGRLGELREAGIVTLSEPDGYALTKIGGELLAAMGPLAAWAGRWSRRLARGR